MTRFPDLTRRAALALALCGGLALGPAMAADLPVIRLVVPFAAGSYTDNVARIIAPAMGRRLNASLIIENKAGANGIIGTDYVAKSKPDGLTFLVGGASINVLNPGLYKKLPYDPVKDLQPVARFGVLPFLLLVHPGVPAKTVPELIAHARSHPGTLAYGTPNAATLVGSESFKRMARIDMLAVQYKASPQAIMDLAGGQIQVLMADFATAMPQVQAGKARLLAVTMEHGSPLLPNVPTVSETVKDFDLSAWTGLLAPAGTPPATIQRVADASLAALADKDVQKALSGIGFDVQPLGPAAFGPYVQSEMLKWNKLIKDAGIQPE